MTYDPCSYDAVSWRVHQEFFGPDDDGAPGPGRTADGGRVSIPWENAAVHAGTAPQQEDLFPKPVLLVCNECGASGYWYPEGNVIELRRPDCPLSIRPGSRVHDWGVLRWNGNVPLKAPYWRG